MGDRNIVLIYTFSPFPFGEAASNRIMALAKCIQTAGYKVIIVANGGERAQDHEPISDTYFYGDIEYRSYAQAGAGKIARILQRNNLIGIIKKKLRVDERHRLSYVYATYRNYGFWQHLVLRYILHLPALVDVTEWHSSSQFKAGRLNPAYWLHNLRIRYLVPAARNIICITTYLENYFRQRGCNTVIIPPQVVAENYRSHQAVTLPPVRLFYAGTAARKDYVDIMLDGLASLGTTEISQIRFTLVGLSRESFIEQFPRSRCYLDKLGESLQVINRVPKAEVDRMLSEAHFLILLRPDRRYSRAGFPSKVPEALAAGVPVLTNLTSDLRLYIKDMINGIVVEDFSAAAFAAAIRRTIKLKDHEYEVMSQHALQTALQEFAFEVHAGAMEKFLDDAKALSS